MNEFGLTISLFLYSLSRLFLALPFHSLTLSLGSFLCLACGGILGSSVVIARITRAIT